jgi:hypothetical protein
MQLIHGAVAARDLIDVDDLDGIHLASCRKISGPSMCWAASELAHA